MSVTCVFVCAYEVCMQVFVYFDSVFVSQEKKTRMKDGEKEKCGEERRRK